MHSGKLIVDAHLLTLYVIGSYDRSLISKHKRCNEFDEIDYDVLIFILSQASEILHSPHVLSEVSNLIRLIGDPIKTKLTSHFSSLLQSSQESYIRSAFAAQHVQHAKLGLADCALLCGRKDVAILTKDFDLYRAAMAEGRKVINFTHVRERIAPRM